MPMRYLCAFVAMALLVAGVLSRAVAAVDGAFESGRLQATVLQTGMAQPMQLAVAPDGRVFWAELQGLVRCLKPGAAQAVTVAKLEVFQQQEGGLLGIALDPAFPSNGHIFLHYASPKLPQGMVSRFTLRGDELDLASEKVLLTFGVQRRNCCHHAGAMRFGPDGSLYISTGDNTQPSGDSDGYAPIDERPNRSDYDAQKSSSNTHDLRGKILRIRPTPEGSYEIPKGNLFPPDGSKGRPEIYVMGCRNPWRYNIDQKTGWLYFGDVGPDAVEDGPRGSRGYDEINQVREAGNYGWPYFVGAGGVYRRYDYATRQVGEPYDPARPLNTSPNNTGARELPPTRDALIWYPPGVSDRFPMLGQGGRTACAGPVYHYDPGLRSDVKLPAHFDNCLFIYEWSRHWIMTVRLDERGGVAAIEPFMPERRIRRPVDIAFTPEGSLYLLEYGESWGANTDSKLVRIDYVRGNRPPRAVAEARDHMGRVPLKAKLSARGSTDADGDALTYEWRRGDTVISKEIDATVEVAEPAAFNVELTVRDPHGGRSSAQVAVLAGNTPPVVRFASPREGDLYEPGERVPYRLEVADEEDGDSEFEADDLATRAFVTGRLGEAKETDESSLPTGLRLARGSDCFNCHSVTQKIVGPAFLDVARRYRGQAGAEEASVQRVIAGSSGVWGQLPMLPHAQHTREEVRQMVAWVYGLSEQAEAPMQARGLSGFIDLPAPAASSLTTGLTLEAGYTDRGRTIGGLALPALAGRASVKLRSRRIEAEAAELRTGTQVLNGAGASGQRFIGDVASGNQLTFRGLRLDTVRRLSVRVASGGLGGEIEFRLDRPDGPVIASLKVEPTGGWDKWKEQSTDIPATAGDHDLVIRFNHPDGRSGLMNLDWVHLGKGS